VDRVEWKRSHGRATAKNIKLEATFKSFESCKSQLENYNSQNFSIIDGPVLNLYICECNVSYLSENYRLTSKLIYINFQDVETYKGSLKDDIETWLKQLTNYGISDWMILIIETIDMKKTKNLLPRQSVLDKVRLDFGAKNGDR
jgi:hypothetical protein